MRIPRASTGALERGQPRKLREQGRSAIPRSPPAWHTVAVNHGQRIDPAANC
jgi:hypothetical protein